MWDVYHPSRCTNTEEKKNKIQPTGTPAFSAGWSPRGLWRISTTVTPPCCKLGQDFRYWWRVTGFCRPNMWLKGSRCQHSTRLFSSVTTDLRSQRRWRPPSGSHHLSRCVTRRILKFASFQLLPASEHQRFSRPRTCGAHTCLGWRGRETQPPPPHGVDGRTGGILLLDESANSSVPFEHGEEPCRFSPAS